MKKFKNFRILTNKKLDDAERAMDWLEARINLNRELNVEIKLYEQNHFWFDPLGKSLDYSDWYGGA